MRRCPPRSACVCIVGLPGVGKTRLALAVADALAALGRPVLVAHTDVMKVTARALVDDAPRGPAWDGDIAGKCAWMARVLDAHIDKARADGYDLVIEGTLAAGCARGRRVHLIGSEDDRVRRVGNKHRAAREALDGADLGAYSAMLSAAAVSSPALTLDAALPVAALVDRCLHELGFHDETL